MSESEYDIARDLWLRQGKAREALEHALKAAELDAENADAAHLVALLYLDFCSRSADDCRLDAAEASARRALKERSDYREARNTLGVILIHQKKYPEAIEILLPLTGDILYETPENAWGNLGWAYLEKGALDRAIDALRRAVAVQPMFCVGHYRLGEAYLRKRQPALATEAFTAALTVEEPGCRQLQVAHLGRAQAELSLGHSAEALADLERCVALAKATPAGKECAEIRARLK